jgi:hypothetical protein
MTVVDDVDDDAPLLACENLAFGFFELEEEGKKKLFCDTGNLNSSLYEDNLFEKKMFSQPSFFFLFHVFISFSTRMYKIKFTFTKFFFNY